MAARLRHPTPVDAELVGLAGPGGTTRLDGVTGAEGLGSEPWRSWVDEVVASWAACLLSDAGLAARAVPALPPGSGAYHRLLFPDPTDSRAAALLRHPDLVSPVARRHEQSPPARLGHGSTPWDTDPRRRHDRPSCHARQPWTPWAHRTVTVRDSLDCTRRPCRRTPCG